MKRRDFLRIGLANVGAALIIPQLALGGATAASVPGSGGLYYTKEAPGRWASKVATHVPNVELTKNADALSVKVITGHEMKGYEHYIVKHVLLDRNFKFLDEHLFDPLKDKAPVSTFTLSGYSGTLYALSMCNLHDIWLSTVEV